MYKKNKIKAKKLYKENKNILKEMTFIGITGTNGKTTTTTLIYKYLRHNNIRATLIGTNGIYINDIHYQSINTTPGIDKLYEIIKISHRLGIKYIIMEVSSHAIVQYRVYGIKFKIKGITNITQDHLDYHKTFKNYKKVKLSFLKKSKIIINDQVKTNKLLINNKYTYGQDNSYFRIKNINLDNKSSSYTLQIKNKNYNFKTNLLGEFNIYNITLFISTLYLLKIFDYNNIQSFLNNNITIDGRMEIFNYNNKTIIVDYAHTPDGMEKVLSFVRKTYNNKIITIFGCGGNRDQYKRKIMGNIASIYSDLLIITSDNPRFEDENKIINDILEGVNINYLINKNRKEAIDEGIKLLENYDTLLILGRGNEDNIKIKDKLIDFNDINYIKEIINNNG